MSPQSHLKVLRKADTQVRSNSLGYPSLRLLSWALKTPFLTPHYPVQNEYFRHESTSSLDFETRKLPGRRGTCIKILPTSNISDDQWLEKVFLGQVKLWV